MGTGQMMITLVALVLLSMVILRITNSFLVTDSIMLESKIKLQAVSIAASLIEEGIGLAFDDNSVDIDSTVVFISNLSDLSNVNNLRPDIDVSTGIYETYGNFDDIDDFNGLNFNTDDSTLIGNKFYKLYGDVYNISCVVDYVSGVNPNIHSATKTWHKRFRVFVTSKVMSNLTSTYRNYRDTVKMSVVQSNFSY
jgi:hypothetical protein